MGLVQNKYKNRRFSEDQENLHYAPIPFVLRTLHCARKCNLGPQKTDLGVFIITSCNSLL